MAATVLYSGKVCDGYDVRISRNGVERTVHFSDKPDFLQAAIDDWDVAETARETAAADLEDWTIVEA